MTDSLRVVYLLGAGASQSELKRIGSDISILMKPVNESVFDKIKRDKRPKELAEYFANSDSQDLNIEFIINLLESFEIRTYTEYASDLRKEFQMCILDAIQKDGAYIEPQLSKSLLYLHKCLTTEKLQGIISLNYDSLIDIAFQRIMNGVNYSINCETNPYYTINNGIFPLIKIHGSFNWELGHPIKITEDKNFLRECRSLWIPPSIQKRTENYPFNYLWGKAFEILKCDVLRIIGCSLNQNDWGLISLLFKTQHILNENAYKIEIISSPKTAKGIVEKYAFLKNVIPLDELEFKVVGEEEINEKGEVDSNVNVFERWLKAKIIHSREFMNDEQKIEMNNIIGENIA